jgi:spermidine/putrescine transport system substrate-binding protein
MAGFAAFLAACSTGGTGGTGGATTAPSASAGEPSASAGGGGGATPSPEVNWANWTYYIDVDPNDPTVYPSLDKFTAKYGTKVNYQEVVEGNEEFFGTIKPALEGGQDTGWDVITLTDWMAARLIRLGWVEAFDQANMPNFVANIRDNYKGTGWDPDMKFHAPWQSGMTGLGFDPAVTGELTSLAAFYTPADPRWKGKTEYLTEMRDTIGLTMLFLGLDPAQPTREACDQSVAKLQEAQAAGIVRDVKGNSYAEDLKSGDAVLAMAWSGDMVQALIDKPTLNFRIADEGGMLWTDNSMIPKGAAHKGTAELLIDFFYDPQIAAEVEAYVNYICPVKGADEAMKAIDPEIASNPLIFPPEDVVAKLHIFGDLSEEDEAYFNEQFAKVLGVG